MPFDPITTAIVVLVLVVAVFGGFLASDQANKRAMRQVEENRRKERANQERLEQERQEQLDEARKAESLALEGARKQMAFAQENIHHVQQAFKQQHDELIGGIRQQAKAGCDAQFKQQFGITRRQNADQLDDDDAVQDYLQEHYASLRDGVLATAIGRFIDQEIDRRLDALEAQAESEAAEAQASEAEAQEQAETTDEIGIPEGAQDVEGADVAEAAGGIEPDGDLTESDETADADDREGTEASDSPETAPPAEADDEAPADDPAAIREGQRPAVEAAVREEFDIDSIRTYLLAAISARYDENGRPIGDLPWPAYTQLSTRGYGELVLAEGAPVYAQDSYREFAWRKFHTGRRAEKPTRGEYAWPESHVLGDGIAVDEVETPAGVFTATGPSGTVPLYELSQCAWMRHCLDYQGALLVPDGQRSFFINIEGMHKDDVIDLHFDAPDFLAELEDGPFFLNAMGEMNGVFVGMSATKPEAASPGEAPYELAERTPTGMRFRLMHDARRYDADTYPQFLEVHLCWCQPPAPKPDRIVRHIAN